MTKSRFVIIGDSSLDYSPELNEWLQVVSVPLSVSIGEQVFVDDEQLDMEPVSYTHLDVYKRQGQLGGTENCLCCDQYFWPGFVG